MQTVLWGGPLDGQELRIPDEAVKIEMVIPVLTHYPPEYADADGINGVFIKHHYVFDNASRRYNYAGDWP
jgi:hypothetical protein